MTEGEDLVYGYRWILGIGRDTDAWKYKTTPDVRLKLPDGREQSTRYHGILAMRESLPEHCGADTPTKQSIRDRLYELNLMMPNWLSVWAILPLLEGYTRHIREIRDSAILDLNGVRIL